VVLERMKKIGCTGRVKYCEVLYGVKKSNILHTIKTRKANRIGLALSWNCLQKHVTEGKLERMIYVTGRRGRRCKQLLDDLRETRESWKLEQEGKELWLGRIRNELMNGSMNQLCCLFVSVNTQRQETLLKLKDGVHTGPALQ
jgi:hypothetical protein